jgi:hypothetical protein
LAGSWFYPVILYILSMISHSLNRVMTGSRIERKRWIAARARDGKIRIPDLPTENLHGADARFDG